MFHSHNTVKSLNVEIYTQTARIFSALSDNVYICQYLSCVHI